MSTLEASCNVLTASVLSKNQRAKQRRQRRKAAIEAERLLEENRHNYYIDYHGARRLRAAARRLQRRARLFWSLFLRNSKLARATEREFIRYLGAINIDHHEYVERRAQINLYHSDAKFWLNIAKDLIDRAISHLDQALEIELKVPPIRNNRELFNKVVIQKSMLLLK